MMTLTLGGVTTIMAAVAVAFSRMRETNSVDRRVGKCLRRVAVQGFPAAAPADRRHLRHDGLRRQHSPLAA